MRTIPAASFRLYLLARFFVNHMGRAGFFLLLQIITNTTKVILLLAIGRGYAQLSGGTSFRAGLLAGIIPGGLPDGAFFAFYFAVLALIWGILNGLEKYQASAFGERFAAFLRSWNHNYRPANPSKSTTLLRYGGDLSGLQRFLVRGILRATGDIILATALWITLLQVDTGSALVALGVLAPGLAFLYWWRYRPANAFQNKRRRQIQLLNWLQKPVEDTHSNHQKFFASKNQRLLTAGLTYRKLSAPVDALAEVLPYLMFAAVLLGAAWRSNLPPVTVLILLLALAPVHRRLLRLPSIWHQGKISLRRLEAVSSSANTPGALKIKTLTPDQVSPALPAEK